MANESFYEWLGFKKNPYSIENPMLSKIPFEFIEWNREDWKKVKEEIDIVLAEINQGLSTCLRIFGGWGSGKTWLMRYLEKKIREKYNDSAFVIYSYVFGIDASFSNFYATVAEDILDESKIESLRNRVNTKPGELSVSQLTNFFNDSNLAKCLYEILMNGINQTEAIQWIKGNKLSTTELNALKISNQNYSNLEKSTTLQNLFNGFNILFEYTVFFADELNNAKGKLGRELCEFFRQTIDLVDERHCLILAYTSQEGGDAWYDYGFTDALLSRIRHTAILTALDENSISPFIKKHHKLYSERNEETLYPYDEEAIKYLIKNFPPEDHYPRQFFKTTATLSIILHLDNKLKNGKPKITKEFINAHRGTIPLTPQTRLE